MCIKFSYTRVRSLANNLFSRAFNYWTDASKFQIANAKHTHTIIKITLNVEISYVF
jgi:hypothetical protein